jgi:Ca2+-binding EF-hand superfamily protein
LKRINIFAIDINADEFNIFQQYSEEEIENFKCIFDMFDKDKTGVVNVQDLQTIMKSLGRDPQEAIDLLEELDFDPAGQMSFEEFLRIMKNLENRLVASKQDEMMG